MSRRPQPRRSQSRGRVPVLALVLAAVVVLGVVAVVASRGGGSSPTAPDGVEQTRSVEVTGTGLPGYTGADPDPGVGRTIPAVTGATFSGAPVRIDPADGRPKLVLFVAHWCPHCQREVPRLTSWLRQHGQPTDVELVTVSTDVQSNAPNYPPSAWLARVGWPVKTMADDGDSTAAGSFGLQSFPYFVAVQADGTVAARASGELTTAQFEHLLDAARAANAS